MLTAHLKELGRAGLSVLAISRHHPSEARNAELMNIETHTPTLLRSFANAGCSFSGLRPRLICVLQRGGIEAVEDIEAYVRWAVSSGVQDVCFKELYVSTSHESVNHSGKTNQWSALHQVPLSLVDEWAETRGFRSVSTLPQARSIYGCRRRHASASPPTPSRASSGSARTESPGAGTSWLLGHVSHPSKIAIA